MGHTVTAPLVVAKGTDGKDVYLYSGSSVPVLLDGEVERLSEAGFLAEVAPEPVEPAPAEKAAK